MKINLKNEFKKDIFFKKMEEKYKKARHTNKYEVRFRNIFNNLSKKLSYLTTEFSLEEETKIFEIVLFKEKLLAKDLDKKTQNDDLISFLFERQEYDYKNCFKEILELNITGLHKPDHWNILRNEYKDLFYVEKPDMDKLEKHFYYFNKFIILCFDIIFKYFNDSHINTKIPQTNIISPEKSLFSEEIFFIPKKELSKLEKERKQTILKIYKNYEKYSNNRNLIRIDNPIFLNYLIKFTYEKSMLNPLNLNQYSTKFIIDKQPKFYHFEKKDDYTSIDLSKMFDSDKASLIKTIKKYNCFDNYFEKSLKEYFFPNDEIISIIAIIEGIKQRRFIRKNNLCKEELLKNIPILYCQVNARETNKLKLYEFLAFEVNKISKFLDSLKYQDLYSIIEYLYNFISQITEYTMFIIKSGVHLKLFDITNNEVQKFRSLLGECEAVIESTLPLDEALYMIWLGSHSNFFEYSE